MKYGMFAIVGICLLVLGMGALKQRFGLLFGFFSRILIDGVGIVCCNFVLKTQEIPVALGINPVSLLTAGSLGISGIAMLYAILFYESL